MLLNEPRPLAPGSVDICFEEVMSRMVAYGSSPGVGAPTTTSGKLSGDTS